MTREEILKKTIDFDDAINRIVRLEKENKELKEEIKNNEDLATVAYMQGADSQKKKDEKQLTKAKEIIAELIRFQPYIDREAMFHRIGNEWKRAIYEGIQFLKEVSE